MEAASARYAARDRWADAQMGHAQTPSQLQRFIQAACSPENYEPNLALNLEIADLINSKKGSAPREAATAIVANINHRNPNVALLALNLLDICVKNCGYPFHLQISTKEFLNELVRRFPERPPIRPSRVQMKILEAIEEWRGTICETSRYKEDLGFIRDMHRLLSYKGYTFPEVRREDAAVLNPSDNLKSAEEMEEEEREAQSAKLQELIRRGTPEDLQEANRLMKVMAGYDTRSKVDYRAKAADEVSKIQQKARLLEERLENFKPGDTMRDGDVYSELAAALSSAQPKIQKMCEEESDDHEAVAKLLEINDSIHRTVERYKLMKKGDVAAANQIAKGTPFTATTASGTGAANELSLIDLDGDADANGSSAAAQPQAGGIENDLLGLSIGDSGFGQGGGIALGFGENTSEHPSTVRAPQSRDTHNGRYPRPGPPFLDDPKLHCSWPGVVNLYPSSGLQRILGLQSRSSRLVYRHASNIGNLCFLCASQTSCRLRSLRHPRLLVKASYAGAIHSPTVINSRRPCNQKRRRRVVLLLGPPITAKRTQSCGLEHQSQDRADGRPA